MKSGSPRPFVVVGPQKTKRILDRGIIMPSTAEVAADPGNVTLQLHKRETAGSGYWGHPGICTVTFCEGDPKVVRRRNQTKAPRSP